MNICVVSSSWWWALSFPKHVERIISSINYCLASSWSLSPHVIDDARTNTHQILHHVYKYFHLEKVQKQWVVHITILSKKNYTVQHIYQRTECHNIDAVDTSNILWMGFIILSVPHVRIWHSQNYKIKSPTPKRRPKFLLLHWRQSDYFWIAGSDMQLYVV